LPSVLIFDIFPEENQYDLFINNGLPLMIQALTESQNEELNKAATYVLHNCRKISKFTVNIIIIPTKVYKGKFIFALMVYHLSHAHIFSLLLVCF
jgi:hypothetical protein